MADLKTESVQSEEIEKLRNLFHETYAENLENGVYDERDTQKIKDDDYYVTKFMRPTYKSTEMASLMHESLKWRKEMDIRDKTASSIPPILWERNGMYFHKADKDGSQILWVEVSKYRKDLNLLAESKLFFAYLMESFYWEHPTEKIVILFDMSNTGLSNYDLDLIRFIIACFKSYYPGILSYLLIYDMPWLFNAIWRIIKTWLRSEEVKFIKFANKNSIQEFINKDNLFDHMGGPCVRESSVESLESLTEGSKSPRKKKVTFAEVETETLANDAVDGEIVNVPHVQPTELEDVTTIGEILTISPSEDLEFTTEHSDDYSATITMWACASKNVAFKIKTTSPEKFKVRPSTGLVKADSYIEVSIVLNPVVRSSINRDRFLVMAVVVEDSEMSLAEMWRTVDKSTILEHKLCCTLTTPQPTPTEPPPPPLSHGDSPQPIITYPDNTDLIKQILRHQQKLERRLHVTLLLLVSIFILLIYVHFYRDDSNANQHCHRQDL